MNLGPQMADFEWTTKRGLKFNTGPLKNINKTSTTLSGKQIAYFKHSMHNAQFFTTCQLLDIL